MKISNKLKPINFGYKTIISDLWKEGKLPTVTKGFYGGDLSNNKKSENFVTNEHIKCHSKGGSTKLHNIALATLKNNNDRGDKPLSDFFSKENFEQYCEQFKGLMIPYIKKGKHKVFNGDEYIKNITNTVTKVLKEEKKLNLLG